ncbi:hypothetical protein [Glaciimonas soli]|uniref:Uncharacterized protein n=1 Tax=Glaciimonas soli TaxID=2590999 RepID=A0A843YT28_9BURK|nr:hypothetical protein [Glaciimonas soli]MQR02340.1 hypothetical protein [Glaciimonas soli]
MRRDKANIRSNLQQQHNINFDDDFFTLRFPQLNALHEAAKACGYRKPQHANGSLACHFFAYLNKK